ncbi:MAG: hypothetical protein V7673_01195 [Paracoccus sp. (in: a-proteobacteria)]|uniref:hypothetical protein n=1 Tax=Paracoccus sp. TaxID=267 RepID=UPI003001958F
MGRTRIVRWLRVLLPLAALAILSTLFLFSRRPEEDSRIPYAQLDAEQMAREPRLVAPDYTGVTDDGAELSLSASEATPPGQGAGAARDVRLDWRRKDGLTADLTAPRAGLADGLIGLRGGVRMTISSGWRMDAPSVDAATDRSLIRATGGVEAEAPFGSIRADRMDLQPKREDGAGAAVLNFSGSVRLIYQP